MKMLPLAIALGLICAASSAFPEEEQNHSAHHPAQAVSPEAAEPAGHEHGDAKSSPVQENMKKIEALMQQIEQTADPTEKRELLAQHLEALREQMRLIRSQHSEMKLSMKEGGKKDGGTMGGMMKDGGMMGGGMMMHKRVEQRIEMLERLLQQMIEREAAEASIGQR